VGSPIGRLRYKTVKRVRETLGSMGLSQGFCFLRKENLMFEKKPIKNATLLKGEEHLYSFEGRLCEWIKKLFSSKEFPNPIEHAYFQAHITNKRLIFEGRSVGGGSVFAGKVGMALLEKIIENSFVRLAGGLYDTWAEGNEKIRALTEGRGYLAFPYADLDCLKSDHDAYWPVLKTNLGGRDPAFWPYNPEGWGLYHRPKEFAVIMERYVRIIPYKV
jgi:hypothetical protein